LAEASRVALHAIDLHSHDSRHEAGSRWLEAEMPLHHIKELPGTRTSARPIRISNAGRIVLQDSIGRFDALRGKPVANEPPTENRPVSHEDTDRSSKDLLH
jgi:hypothetical protein